MLCEAVESPDALITPLQIYLLLHFQSCSVTSPLFFSLSPSFLEFYTPAHKCIDAKKEWKKNPAVNNHCKKEKQLVLTTSLCFGFIWKTFCFTSSRSGTENWSFVSVGSKESIIASLKVIGRKKNFVL